MYKAALLFMLLLVGCGKDLTVPITPLGYNNAIEACSPYGGVRFIIPISTVDEWVACGYKCTQRTGKTTYTEKIHCVDGTLINLSFTAAKLQTN